MNGPGGLVITESFIYWTNQFTFTIGRANIDGTNVNNSFISTGQVPFGLAVDDSYIYWSNAGTDNTIGRANLDGTGVNNTFITLPTVIQGLAVGPGE